MIAAAVMCGMLAVPSRPPADRPGMADAGLPLLLTAGSCDVAGFVTRKEGGGSTFTPRMWEGAATATCGSIAVAAALIHDLEGFAVDCCLSCFCCRTGCVSLTKHSNLAPKSSVHRLVNIHVCRCQAPLFVQVVFILLGFPLCDWCKGADNGCRRKRSCSFQ